MKVYVIETGVYSDRRVVAVHEERETSEALAKVLDHGRVTPFEVGGYVDEARAGLILWSVEMDRAGNTRHVEQTDRFPDPDEIDVLYQDGFDTVCWARDREHAVKIANERRIMALAQGGR